MRRLRRAIGPAGAALLAFLAQTGLIAAQTAGTPTTAAVRVGRAVAVTAGPRIDGRLDEAVWMQAAPLTGLVQREPQEGAASSQRTEVRFLTDAEALYVGAWLFDDTPDAIVRGEKIRDVTLTNSDYFGFILDTYFDHQNGFVFSTTPAGVEYDGQVVKEGEGGGVSVAGVSRAQSGALGGFNLNWDASWTVATSLDSLGWYAEFRIPFSTLRYGGGDVQTWGLNLVRGIRRRNEEAFWSPVPRQYNIMRLSRAGVLEGLQVPSRRIATVTPYVLSSLEKQYDAVVPTKADASSDVGVDVKLGLTPSLTLDLTVNTDFAQVEVDEQRTNLTRFPLFFPEKRPFFLENAGVFSAGTPQQADLFFSRRIGIDSLGQPVPILGGGRVTGRLGGLSVGLLQIFTDDVEGGVDANAYTVARISRELPGRSRIGVMAVQRMATSDAGDRNRTFALDGRLGFGDDWTMDWWGAKTATPGLDGRDAAMSFHLGWQTNRWNNGLRYSQVGEDFNPEVGFLSRAGYRYYEASVFRTIPIHGSGLFRYWLPHASYRGYFGFDGKMQSEQYHIDVGEADFHNGGRFGPELNVYGEGLTEPFEIADGVVLPVGDYRWVTNGWDFATNPSAPVSLNVRLDLGGFYNGSRYGGNATLTVRRGASLNTSLLVDYNDVHLDQGKFVRSLVGLRVGYFFTPRIFVQSLVQYSNQAEVFSANVRFAWLNTAGTGLFIVLNDAEEATGAVDWTRPLTRSLVVKFTRQFGTGG